MCVELPALQPLQLQVWFARVPWQNHWYFLHARACCMPVRARTRSASYVRGGHASIQPDCEGP